MNFNFLWCFYTAILQFPIALDAYADYYWRDYDGSIPCDAVQGGTDKCGYYTYIGQIAVPDFDSPNLVNLISARIFKGQKTAYADGNLSRESDVGVKILCSSRPDKLRWSETIPSNCELIRGSFTVNDEHYYIGRTWIQEQNVTGRYSRATRTLSIPWTTLPNPHQKIDRVKRDLLMYCAVLGNSS